MSEHAGYVDPLDDEGLETLLEYVKAEVSRRVTINNAEAQIREISQRVRAAAGIEPGDPWDPMMRTRGGYGKGDTVTHKGPRYESLVDNNTHEPGDGPPANRWWNRLN